MSEEVKELNDGTFSGLKKTIIGTLGTLVTAGGVWVSTTIFQGSEAKEETKTEQVAAPAPVVVNIQNTNQQKQTSGGTNTIIKERVVEKSAAPAPAKKEKKSETEDAPW
jgi:flagellar basal body-associated protein FliL